MPDFTPQPVLPSFKHPPVNEVSFGVVFRAIDSLQTRHFGQFWVEHKSEFPRTEDASPLIDAAELEGQRLVVLDTPPFRRMMCYSADQQYAAQIQESRLYLNWRKLGSQTEYPRYPVIHEHFEKLVSDFSSFAERENCGTLSPVRYELAYVNHIELNDAIAASIEHYFKLFRFSPIGAQYVSPPESVNATWKFAMPHQRGTGTVNLSHGKNPKGQNVLVLGFTCSGTPSEKFTASEWYQSAHEWIVRGFTDLTTDAAHKEWERER